MRPGSINSSIFSLVIICLGTGTLTIPNIFYLNGFVLGSFLIIFAAIMSAFTGYLIAYCCAKTNGTCFEEVAMATYGKNMQYFTIGCMICCNLGFVVCYIVLFKSLVPYSIRMAIGHPLPSWCDESKTGQIFWAVLFSVRISRVF